jgi:hypothetical protein
LLVLKTRSVKIPIITKSIQESADAYPIEGDDENAVKYMLITKKSKEFLGPAFPPVSTNTPPKV